MQAYRPDWVDQLADCFEGAFVHTCQRKREERPISAAILTDAMLADINRLRRLRGCYRRGRQDYVQTVIFVDNKIINVRCDRRAYTFRRLPCRR